MKYAALVLASASVLCHAFSVYDDLLAFPQYEVVFADSYTLETEAESQLAFAASLASTRPKFATVSTSLQSTETAAVASPQNAYRPGREEIDHSSESSDLRYAHEYMKIDGLPYLCSIPRVSLPLHNESAADASKAEEEKELVRATDRGWELIKDLENSCLYFVSGWWSYSFCYNTEVKQFHHLPQSRNGAPTWPPIEDEAVPSYILGHSLIASDNAHEGGSTFRESHSGGGNAHTTDVVQVQSKGESRYLVQKLADGTTCDLTGRPRRIDVQYHCHPQTVDRIGWIKEVSTCAYLMVVYTQRLCNDVAFQPPRAKQAHKIICKEIVSEEGVEAWEAERINKAQQKQLAQDSGQASPRPTVGGIEVGGMINVGQPGRRIEPPKVAKPGDEKVRTVAKWHPEENDGKPIRLSNQDLRELDLDLPTVKQMSDELQRMSGGKPWVLELTEGPNGIRELRGIVDDDENEDVRDERPDRAMDEQDQEGSQEDYRDEL